MSAKSDKKTPETRKTDAKAKVEEKIDRQMKDSFPASDPPSFSGGQHFVGAPVERESDSPDSRSVKDAEKKVKSGDAKAPETY